MEVCMKQRWVIKFLRAEKIAPIDIHQHTLNVYGDQTVDVNTARWWMESFSDGDNNNGSPQLVQTFTGTVCSLFFINNKNGDDYVEN